MKQIKWRHFSQATGKYPVEPTGCCGILAFQPIYDSRIFFEITDYLILDAFPFIRAVEWKFEPGEKTCGPPNNAKLPSNQATVSGVKARTTCATTRGPRNYLIRKKKGKYHLTSIVLLNDNFLCTKPEWSE